MPQPRGKSLPWGERLLAQIAQQFHCPSIGVQAQAPVLARYADHTVSRLPDAIADIDVVRDDLRQIAAVGAGFEFLAYYEAGHDPSRWGKFGYGSDSFLPIFRAVMETAEEQGIPMDFAIGANQGQGVPSKPGTEGLALHLTYSNVTVAPGQTFKGTLPLTTNKRPSFMHHLEEFGEQTLIAVVAIEVRQAPKAAPGATWRIMGWYERFTNQRSIDGPSDAKTYLQNGSWIVDHFSAAGARIMDQFFDDHIVPEQSDRDLLASVGKYAWEDSMEMDSTLWWTRGFDKDFKRALGYDIRTCLPLLLIKENGWAQVRIAYDEEFYSKNMTRGEECNKDYRSVLQTKYEEYIQAHAEWARSKGLKFSNQPAYNLPLSMTESSPLLDAPEGESLGFFERIDAYKYLSGPAHFKKHPKV
ncbi:hypothetical protein NW760_012216 [Fusarium oxysporum]|nr:hypothetical protein NW760_012216 [Fusarium oxysporum]